MILGEEAVKKLIEECEITETGISSHWVEMLQEFEYKNEKFLGKGLPEGEGSSKKTIIHDLVHYLLQTPFRLQGAQFQEFKKILRTAKKIHEYRNNKMRIGTLRQVISLAFLEEQIKVNQLTEPVVIIGDGFGLMASLILSHFSKLAAKIVVVNLTQNLLIDAVFIKKSVPEVDIALVKDEKEYNKALKSDEIRCILIQAHNSKLLEKESIGLVINICSMQEMNTNIIEEYFDSIRKSHNKKTYFYCVNRVEKILPDGTIVNFFKYPWHSQDQVLIDELCPWQQKYYSIRPPFYFFYDGPIQHRLILFHKNDTVRL
jgi:putative sugar O-methyltransferase